MKTTIVLMTMFLAVFAPSVAADTVDELVGTWSGGWVPRGGVRDAVTVEFKKDDKGGLAGRFVTPSSMTFSKLSFNPKTRMLLLEAVDGKSGKQYKLNAKMQGAELTGSLAANDVSGELHLTKWTFAPRVGD